MKQYLDLVQHVLDHGDERPDRTGTGTLSVFGTQTKYDLREGFPLVTTKKVLFDAVVRELVWFLRGSTNIRDDLTQHTPIWDAWADANGELGPIYGFQWRNWGGTGVDQISQAIELIQKDPSSRRILVSAWNVGDVPKMRLPPCHVMFQFYVLRGRLDCQLYQRSADIALGVPFNIASYALLMVLMAGECGLQPGIFTHTLGDAHIYQNHIEGLKKQLAREPKPLPRVKVTPGKRVLEARFEDIELVGYEHHPFIKFRNRRVIELGRMIDLEIVVAADEGGGIGRAGELPWRLPGDTAFLKRITSDASAQNLRNAVIMGRKTWETIPPRFRPLPRRLNVVVTHQADYEVPDGVIRAASVAEALARAREDASVERAFVLGGGEIYRIAIEMPECRRIYLTRVEGHFEADARFPDVPASRFHLAEASSRHEENGIGYAFQRWERV